MRNNFNIQLRISYRTLVRLTYARTTDPKYFNDEKLFYRTLLTRGLNVIKEEMRMGEEIESPPRVSPYPEDVFDYAAISKNPEDIETLELSVDGRTINAILDYLNSIGEKWPSHQPLPQTISERLLLKGLDDLGWEYWDEAEKHDK